MSRCAFRYHDAKLFVRLEDDPLHEVPFGTREFYRKLLGNDRRDEAQVDRIEGIAYDLQRLDLYLNHLLTQRTITPAVARELKEQAKAAALEELDRDLIETRSDIQHHRSVYTRASDIPFFDHPIDWMIATVLPDPVPFQREEALVEALRELGFAEYRFAPQSSVYRRSLGKYVELVRRSAAQGIDRKEAETLFEIASHAENPEIPLFLRQFVKRESFVTRRSPADISGDRDVTMLSGANLCLNFGKEERKLLCGAIGMVGVSYDGSEAIPVLPSKMTFQDESVRDEMALRIDSLPFFRARIRVSQAVEIAHEHAANMTLVGMMIHRAYGEVFLPETAAILSGALLNSFALTDEIDAETRKLYANMVVREIHGFGERFLNRVDSLGLIDDSTLQEDNQTGDLFVYFQEPRAVKPFYADVKHDLAVMHELHREHARRVQARLTGDQWQVHSLLTTNEDVALTSTSQYYNHSWVNVRTRLLDPQYLAAVNDVGQDMTSAYLGLTRDHYDRFWSNLFPGGEGGSMIPDISMFGGFMLGSKYARWAGQTGKIGLMRKFGIFIPPIAATMVTGSCLVSSSEANQRLPIPMFGPRVASYPLFKLSDDVRKRPSTPSHP